MCNRLHWEWLHKLMMTEMMKLSPSCKQYGLWPREWYWLVKRRFCLRSLAHNYQFILSVYDLMWFSAFHLRKTLFWRDLGLLGTGVYVLNMVKTCNFLIWISHLNCILASSLMWSKSCSFVSANNIWKQGQPFYIIVWFQGHLTSSSLTVLNSAS